MGKVGGDVDGHYSILILKQYLEGTFGLFFGKEVVQSSTDACADNTAENFLFNFLL